MADGTLQIILNRSSLRSHFCQLDVLEYVHSHGIIHCDVKPSNIMLGRGANESLVYLGDFGISLPFDPNAPPSERTTLPRGSGYYMSLNNHLRRGETYRIRSMQVLIFTHCT